MGEETKDREKRQKSKETEKPLLLDTWIPRFTHGCPRTGLKENELADKKRKGTLCLDETEDA